MPNHGDSQSRLRADIHNLKAKENMLDELIRNAGEYPIFGGYRFQFII